VRSPRWILPWLPLTDIDVRHFECGYASSLIEPSLLALTASVLSLNHRFVQSLSRTTCNWILRDVRIQDDNHLVKTVVSQKILAHTV
jgi:hypothetical protein